MKEYLKSEEKNNTKKEINKSPEEELPDVIISDEWIKENILEKNNWEILFTLSSEQNHEIALKLIEAGNGNSMANNLKKFQGLDHKEIALKIIEAGVGYSVANNLNEFQGLDKEVALKLIEAGRGDSVARFLDKFQGLDNEVAFKLIEIDEEYFVVEHLTKFQGLDKEVALKLIENRRGEYVVNNLDKFQGLDEEVALKIIEGGGGRDVAENLDKFQGLDHKEIALKLIEVGQGNYIFEYLDKFKGLDHKEITLKLIEVGMGEHVVKDLEKFQGLDHKEIVLKLIDARRGECVVRHLDKFQGLDHKEVAMKLIEIGKGAYMEHSLYKFQGLDKEVALKLIENGAGGSVVDNLDKFQGLDRQEIAQALTVSGQIHLMFDMRDSDGEPISKWTSWATVFVQEKFEKVNFYKITQGLIADGNFRSLLINCRYFFSININEYLPQILESVDRKTICENIDKFEDKSHPIIAQKFIKDGYFDFLADYSNNFNYLDNEIALAFIKAGKVNLVDKSYGSFWGGHLDEFVACQLVTAGYCKDIDGEHASQWFDFTEQTLSIAKKRHLTISETLFIKDKLGMSAVQEIKDEEIFDFLTDNVHEWQDEQNIRGPFAAGAELFGADKMFQYLDRQELSRHDGLHNFHRIVTMAKSSNLSLQAFYNNILEQVRRDDVTYDDGTAHHHLNSLVSNLSLDFAATRAIAGQYQDIEKLQELTKMLDAPETIFASWKNLKKYEEVVKLLERADILKQLQELKKSGNMPLYHYIETLAFHPNIEMEKVFQFWENPQEFLELGDSHTPEQVHSRKKPSNYVEFPNLDLSAAELRDALVNGQYDTLQVFKPLSIEYTIPKQEARMFISPLHQEVVRALGKRKEGIKGEAKNSPKLFKEIQEILKAANVPLNDFLSGAKEISESVAIKIKEQLYDSSIGLPLFKKDLEEYRAKINLKSDPDGVVAGNDTACCMPFGSGKNNVYTFNPDCSLFTLQKKNASGTWRTVAQSVLTKDVAIGKNVSEVVGAMQEEGAHLNSIIPEEILRNRESVIACDNIEVAPNFRSDDQLIATIYQDFFREYCQQFGKEDGIDGSQVVIGKGYTDALTDLPSINNEYVPRAPVGYSDKLGDSVYTLTLSKETKSAKTNKTLFLSRNVQVAPHQKNKESSVILPKGIFPLTFEDSLPVAYIEGKAYRDNESLIEYLHNMENALIAKDVNNAAKNRPNMSFKYQDDNKIMHGYILAYEGRVDKEGESVVYVSDLASDGNTRAGGSLILGFTEAYKQNYLDKKQFIPIYAQMREKTSYAIITKQLEKLSRGAGINFEIEELESYEVGNDTMHRVMIRPVESRI